MVNFQLLEYESRSIYACYWSMLFNIKISGLVSATRGKTFKHL